MELRSYEQRILSRPFPVEWAGWESTTYYLQRCGWKIATQYDYSDDRYRFAFQHAQMDLMGWADWMHIDRATALMYTPDNQLPPIHVGYVARRLEVFREEFHEGVGSWHLVDARQQLSCEPIRTMEDFSVFAKLQPKEILIPQADMSVVEQLEAIIRAQEPKQHELRQLILAKPRGLRQIASIAEVA